MSRLLSHHDLATVKVNVVHPDAVVPTYGTELSAGFDLSLVEHVFLDPGESGVYRTGLIIQPPPDHMLLITPRSSTWKKYRVSLGNTVGILDEDFCGPEDEVRLYLHNPGASIDPNWGTRSVHIAPGLRLATGIFVPITRATFEVVEGPLAKTRGGWGSTGD